MPNISINHVLQTELKHGDMIDIAYPKGKTEGSFFGAFNHNLSIGDQFFRAPKDFLIVCTPQQIQLHWRRNITIPRGEILYIKLEELGTDFYFDRPTGVTVQNMTAANVFMINLQAPRARLRQHYFALSQVTSAGALPLRNHMPDVPRNVTILSDANDTMRLFRINGEDIYGHPMTEHIQGPNVGIRPGKKAFTRITSISVDGACSGKIAAGFGNRLGLPAYLPAAGYVLKELVNGETPPAGILIPGDTAVPSPTTGDRRGTYTPSPRITLDGRSVIHLLVALPNPGNIGAPDYFES